MNQNEQQDANGRQYFSLLKEIYSPPSTSDGVEPFENAYRSLWRYILEHEPIKRVSVKDQQTKSTNKDVVIDDEWFSRLLEKAEMLGFHSGPIEDRSSDHATVAALAMLQRYGAGRNVTSIDHSAVEIVAEQLRIIDGRAPTAEDLRLTLYGNADCAIANREGSKLHSPPDEVVFCHCAKGHQTTRLGQGLLKRPCKSLGKVGVSEVYVAAATFAIFFGSPLYEGEILMGTTNDDPSDMNEGPLADKDKPQIEDGEGSGFTTGDEAMGDGVGGGFMTGDEAGGELMGGEELEKEEKEVEEVEEVEMEEEESIEGEEELLWKGKEKEGEARRGKVRRVGMRSSDRFSQRHGVGKYNSLKAEPKGREPTRRRRKKERVGGGEKEQKVEPFQPGEKEQQPQPPEEEEQQPPEELIQEMEVEQQQPREGEHGQEEEGRRAGEGGWNKREEEERTRRGKVHRVGTRSSDRLLGRRGGEKQEPVLERARPKRKREQGEEEDSIRVGGVGRIQRVQESTRVTGVRAQQEVEVR